MRCAGRPPTSSPRNLIRPALGARSPDSRFKNVVLPAPFGPITACTPPARKARLTPSTAVNPPNRRYNASVCRMMSLIRFLHLGAAAGADSGQAVGEEQHDGNDEEADSQQPVLCGGL